MKPASPINRGVRFGRLIVLDAAGTDKWGSHLSRCLCDCGNETITLNSSLRGGKTLSCGCLQRERASISNTTHGKTNTRLFGIWMGMKNRCYIPSNKEYARYGGRGITICDEWKDDFMAFYTWSMSNGYMDGLSIDRIDNDNGYSPNNCRWITIRAQQNNRCNNKFLSFNGKTKTLSEWAEETKIPAAVIGQRLRCGWSVPRALTTPRRCKNEP